MKVKGRGGSTRPVLDERFLKARLTGARFLTRTLL